MVKADLIKRVMEETDLESPAAKQAVDALFQCLDSALERGDRVVLRRFGIFHAGLRKTGVARNPRTGEAVRILLGRVVRFRAATELRSFPRWRLSERRAVRAESLHRLPTLVTGLALTFGASAEAREMTTSGRGASCARLVAKR